MNKKNYGWKWFKGRKFKPTWSDFIAMLDSELYKNQQLINKLK